MQEIKGGEKEGEKEAGKREGEGEKGEYWEAENRAEATSQF